ncbi:MAG TPA: hypothetical protein PK530_05890 [Anaerolineales bacterium]|nr:hypothetical protein [Anaerolineales bacterium]
MSDLTPEERTLLTEAVKDFNDKLLTYSINLSAQAFTNAMKLGCGLLALPVAIVLLIAWAQEKLDFSGIFVYTCAGVTIATVFAAFISRRAKQIAIRDNYTQDINPEIVQYLADNHFTRRQFDRIADDILAADAPLREYLVKPSS